MCLLIKSEGFCIPTDGELGIQSVYERAKRLSRDFATVKVCKELSGGKFLTLRVFGEKTKNSKSRKTSKK